MSNKLFVYEKGNCRGDEFQSKSTFNKCVVIEILEQSLLIPQEDIDEHFEKIVEGFNIDNNVMYELMKGGLRYGVEEAQQNRVEWLAKIKNNEPFCIEGEESSWGIANTTLLAVLSNNTSSVDLNEENWK